MDLDRDRRSKGTGKVVFESRDDLDEAISRFDGFEWHGRKLGVTLEVRLVW